MKVLFVTTTLDTGGAETALLRLLSTLNGIEASVVSMNPCDGLPIAEQIKSLGIPIHGLNMNPSRPNPLVLLRLLKVIRDFRPKIIQGWMYHANLLSTLAGSVSRTPICWGVRQCLYSISTERRMTRGVIRASARASRAATSIVYNSKLASTQHENVGFSASKSAIISNGFDCTVLRPDIAARVRIRKELGVADSEILIGLIARYHPMKDHATFLAAAGRVAEPRARFVLAGKMASADNPELVNLIEKFGLNGRVLLLGNRTDVPALNSALDIACSSSWSEGFSNTIGEAMACGVPCVATNVGESGEIISDTGIVVPPRDPASFADALIKMINAGQEARDKLGRLARQRIESHFPAKLVAERYEHLYNSI